METFFSKNFNWILVPMFCLCAFSSCKHQIDLLENTGTPPTNLTYSPNSLEFEQGIKSKSLTPTIKGDTSFSYQITTSPYTTPTQVSIDNQGIIYIDSTVTLGSYSTTVTVTNPHGATTFINPFSFSITNTPTAPSNLIYSPNILNLAEGVSGNSVVPSVNGTVPLSYTITTTPTNSNIVIDSLSGVISVTNTIPFGTYTCDVTTVNSAGSATFTNAYTIAVAAQAPSNLIYAPNSMGLLVSSTIGSSVTPSIEGSQPITYSITSTPPTTNISIDSLGVISVQDGLVIGVYVIDVSATNSVSTTVFDSVFTVNVSTSASAPSNLLYSPNSLTLNQSISGSSVVPSISGTTPITFSLTSSPVTSEISIDANNGIITASSLLDPGSYDINVTATNTAGSISFPSAYSITVNAAILPSNLVYSPNSSSLTSGTTGISGTPTINGTQLITYSLISLPSDPGISIDVNTGVISITSAVAIGTYNIDITATNIAGSTPFNSIYTITITPPLVSYVTDIYPIIVANCNNCHTTGPQSIYTLYSNASADANLIYDRITRTQVSAGFMPKLGVPLLQAEQDLILQWINDGLQP